MTANVNHATWANALAYLNGTYNPLNHKLCRLALFRCLKAPRKVSVHEHSDAP